MQKRHCDQTQSLQLQLALSYNNFINIPYIIIIIILYLSAHVQRTKQALGIAPHEALSKKKKHTQKSLLRHYVYIHMLVDT